MTTRTIWRTAVLFLGSLLFVGVALPSTARELTLDERIAARKAIESVYWSHRAWPADNPGPKPPLDAILSDAAIRTKVEDELRMSALLEGFWHEPVTGTMLQAEIVRMVQESKMPETLRELFAALHDDPTLIAECLARPAVVNRKVLSLFVSDPRIHGAQRAALEAELAGKRDVAALSRLPGDRVERTISVEDGETWDGLSFELAEGFRLAPERVLQDVPTGRVSRLVDRGDRFAVFAVRAKDQASVTLVTMSWPKVEFGDWSQQAKSEARGPSAIEPPPLGYALPAIPEGSSCLNGAWEVSILNAAQGTNRPTARQLHTAVWTGAEMIVWGGWDGVATAYATGGRYDPATDTWGLTSLTSGSGAFVPVARYRHTAIWTGTEMIVWGGVTAASAALNTGGRYDPANDTWANSSLTNASGTNVPSPRQLHTSLWTGTSMIVWGGTPSVGASAVNTGGIYDPAADTWSLSALTSGAQSNTPSARSEHTAVWTGSEMIVWGGMGTSAATVKTGGRYDPAADTWSLSSLTSGAGSYTPSTRYRHTAVWTGNAMIVWGGSPGGSAGALNNGGRYNPNSDLWELTTLTSATGSYVPTARQLHSVVWTGVEMIVWGGSTDGAAGVLNTGGRYVPSSDAWALSSLTNATGTNNPSARQFHSAIWTGLADQHMIVWGGAPNSGTGGLFCAVCPSRLWFQDADGDGYGNSGATQSSCFQPAGYVVQNGDCNDADASIHPGATEVCNGVDDNCDAVIDNGGGVLCTDGLACTTDICNGAAGCLATHASANFDTTTFSANRVDGKDLVVLAAAWNSCPGDPLYNAAANLDLAGCIDMTDFHLFMTTFGQDCP